MVVQRAFRRSILMLTTPTLRQYAIQAKLMFGCVQQHNVQHNQRHQHHRRIRVPARVCLFALPKVAPRHGLRRQQVWPNPLA